LNDGDVCGVVLLEVIENEDCLVLPQWKEEKIFRQCLGRKLVKLAIDVMKVMVKLIIGLVKVEDHDSDAQCIQSGEVLVHQVEM